jgi:hypothetical protein
VRRVVLALAGVATFAFGVIAASVTSPVDAQDTTDDRLSALETAVANQGDELSSLRARVQALEDAAQPSNGEGDSGGTGANEAGTVTLSGSGSLVTDKFRLAAGRYKVTATVEVTSEFEGFAVSVYAPAEEFPDLLFNEVIEGAQTFTSSAVYEASEDGEYYVEVGNTQSAWSLVFEPI